VHAFRASSHIGCLAHMRTYPTHALERRGANRMHGHCANAYRLEGRKGNSLSRPRPKARTQRVCADLELRFLITTQPRPPARARRQAPAVTASPQTPGARALNAVLPLFALWWRCSAPSNGTRFCGLTCGERSEVETMRPTATTTAVVTAGTRAAPLPPLLRAAAAARVGSAAASTLILAAAPPQAAPGRALEYPALRAG